MTNKDAQIKEQVEAYMQAKTILFEDEEKIRKKKKDIEDTLLNLKNKKKEEGIFVEHLDELNKKINSLEGVLIDLTYNEKQVQMVHEIIAKEAAKTTFPDEYKEYQQAIASTTKEEFLEHKQKIKHQEEFENNGRAQAVLMICEKLSEEIEAVIQKTDLLLAEVNKWIDSIEKDEEQSEEKKESKDIDLKQTQDEEQTKDEEQKESPDAESTVNSSHSEEDEDLDPYIDEIDPDENDNPKIAGLERLQNMMKM